MDEDVGELANLRAENARLEADNRGLHAKIDRLEADDRGLRLVLSGMGQALCRAAEVSYSSEQDLPQPGIDLRIGENGRDDGVLDGVGRQVAEMDREVARRDV
jgi:hypothetical protein